MSVGFHYFETIHQSLVLQWVPKTDAPHFLDRALAVKAAGSILVFGSLWLMLEYFHVFYVVIYSVFGGLGVLIVAVIAVSFPLFSQPTTQHKHLVLRKSYWLFYVLTFLSGARRQIFVVFAGFLLVEKFDYSAASIALLFLANYVFNLFFAAKIGKLIGVIGERRALTIEYVGLIVAFVSYGLVESSTIAAALYIVDHFFFAFAIAIKTYFQKNARDADVASTAGVSFTISHIAAVVLPALLGFIWLHDASLVFYIGAAIAVLSLVLSQLIPDDPSLGEEIREQQFLQRWRLKN